MSLDDCPSFEYGEEDFIPHTTPWADKEPTRLSKFDKELQERWDLAMTRGAFRYDISNLQTRILPGPSGYVAQLNTMRAIARRAPQKIMSVQQPFNPEEFHFNKVKPIEVIFNLSRSESKVKVETNTVSHIEADSIHSTHQNGFGISSTDVKDSGISVEQSKHNDQEEVTSKCPNCDLASDQKQHISSHGSHSSGRSDQSADTQDKSHMLVINVSPMEYGHCLLVPNRKKCLPQVMTEESYVVAIETMLLSGHRGLRMGFNSLCAFASVNHLHLHMFYLEYELISDFCSVQPLSGMYHEYTALPCPGFALQLHGTTVKELARQASRITDYLYDNNIAHNMFMCRGVVFGENRNSHLTTIRLFIWPRKKNIGSKSSEEFNVACIELVGHLPVKIEDGFHSLTEPDVNAILANACLPQPEYEAIKAKVIEMGNESTSSLEGQSRESRMP